MKTTRVTDIYVRVEVSTPWIYKDEEDRIKRMASTARDIVPSIMRHVDGVRSASVEEEVETVCSHCGRNWTEDSDTFNGGCCDADMENEPEAEEK